MIKVNWDVEELVALIDVYRRSDENPLNRLRLSYWLCQRLLLNAPNGLV